MTTESASGQQLGFSKVKGFRLEDFDVTCPAVESRTCPEKVRLVSEYVGWVKKSSDNEDALQDRDIASIKLGEYRVWARDDCKAASEDECPTRERMNESKTRQTAVSIARTIMTKFGIRGH